MANTQLTRRFLADWPAPFTPEGELVYAAPRRQNELIAIGHQQVELQKAATKAIVRSNLAGAEIIANEIGHQTSVLTAGLRECSDRISSSVMDAADQLSSVFEAVGDRLCAYLGEISWQLAQQSETLTGILHTLRENRSNEARQLVEQGVRHYVNEQYDRAEARFQEALRQDTTDYQVLMNLGLVAVHKGLSDDAFEFFQDALRLPTGLDKLSKNRALLAIARLHYAAGEHDKALNAAQQAVRLADPGQASDIFFLVGVYAALAGRVDESLQWLEKAIKIRPNLISKAAVEPDLDVHRPAVLSLLSRLASEAFEGATKQLTALKKGFIGSQGKADNSERQLASVIGEYLDRTSAILGHKPTYSDCVAASHNLAVLTAPAANLAKLRTLLRRKVDIDEASERMTSEIDTYKAGIPARSDLAESWGCAYVIGFFVLWILIGSGSSAGAGFMASLIIALVSYGLARGLDASNKNDRERMAEVQSSMEGDRKKLSEESTRLRHMICDLAAASLKELGALIPRPDLRPNRS